MVYLMNQRHIWNPVKHLQRSIFAKTVNGYKSVNYFCKKSSIVDVRLGSKCASVKI